jgi:hypothetical protein
MGFLLTIDFTPASLLYLHWEIHRSILQGIFLKPLRDHMQCDNAKAASGRGCGGFHSQRGLPCKTLRKWQNLDSDFSIHSIPEISMMDVKSGISRKIGWVYTPSRKFFRRPHL